MTSRFVLRLAMLALLSVATCAPLVKAQPPDTPEATLPDATPTPDATATPEPTVAPDPDFDPFAPDLVPPIDPDEETQPTPTPEPTEQTPDTENPSDPNAPEAASSINVAIGLTGAHTASNLVAINNRKTCLIRLTAPLTGGVTSTTVWLTSPDDRVRFVGGNAKNQLQLTLSSDLSSVAFDVIGTIGSKAPNDAVINAHRNYPTTAICGKLNLTVWWTSYTKMGVTQGSAYDITTPTTDATYGPTNGNIAVHLRGQYTLNPAGANFSGFGIAILQNFRSSGYSIVLDSPSVKWGTAPKGYTVQENSTIRHTSSVPDVANDCLPGAWPVYSPAQPASSGVNSVYTTDGPNITTAHPNIKQYTNASGVLVTTTWRTAASIDLNARDWAMTYIKSTGELYAAAESNWALDASTAHTGVQKVRNGSSHAVQNSRVIGTAATIANEILKNNNSFSVSGVSSFTRP